MKRLTLNEMLDEVKARLGHKYWNYSYRLNDWFFPSDLCPHNARFKYKCAKLYEAGMIERRGDKTDRWGYSYRVRLEA